MKLSDLMDTMPFPDFSKEDLKSEGKMQHGLEVCSFEYNDTIIYGCKMSDHFAAFVQLKNEQIPKLSQVLNVLSMKTREEFKGHNYTFKLLNFLVIHLGKSIILGDAHSIATEKVLPKISAIFNIKLVNIETGELRDWSEDDYQRLTVRHGKPTEWRVLFLGDSNHPRITEDKPDVLPGCGGRYMWTYWEYFEGLEEL